MNKWNCFKAIIKWLPLAPLSFLMDILAYILSPFLSLYSVIKNVDELKSPWNWFYTHDESLDGWKTIWKDANVNNKFKLWYYRMKWICRNPSYRFNSEIIGFKDHTIIERYEANNLDEYKFKKSGTWQFVLFDTTRGNYFTFRWNPRITKTLNGKIWFGWQDYVLDGDKSNSHMLKFSLKIEKTKMPS